MTLPHMTIKARIFSSSKRTFDCRPDGGTGLIPATAPAKLLKVDHLVVGDRVELVQAQEGTWHIDTVDPRTSFIFRNLPRTREKKIIAANVDAVLIVMSAELPAYKRGLVDRYLVRAQQWGLPALVVFNKMDLFPHDFDIKFEVARLESIGVTCFEVSAQDPGLTPKFMSHGFAELKDKLKGNTAILLGQSGVGKSRLIKELSGGLADLLSGELGKVGKGQHTTTWAELVDCGEFTLVDSPGVRSMSLSDMTEEELLLCFPDVSEHATKCKFNNCTHAAGVKGCWFNALKVEDQSSRLVLSRLESFKRILEEVKGIPDWEKEP